MERLRTSWRSASETSILVPRSKQVPEPWHFYVLFNISFFSAQLSIHLIMLSRFWLHTVFFKKLRSKFIFFQALTTMVQPFFAAIRYRYIATWGGGPGRQLIP